MPLKAEQIDLSDLILELLGHQDFKVDVTDLITSNLNSINSNDTDISNNLTEININKDNIASNLLEITGNNDDISTNMTKINTNASSIEDNDIKIGNMELNTVATDITSSINEIHNEYDTHKNNTDIHNTEEQIKETIRNTYLPVANDINYLENGDGTVTLSLNLLQNNNFTTLSSDVDSNTSNIGTLTNLNTTNKANLVQSISEVNSPSNILGKLKIVDGVGSGIDSDLLDGEEGSFYTNATNINSGTIPDTHLPDTITSDITGNSATTTKLENGFNLNLGGDVTGSITGDTSGLNIIDGSENVTLDINILNDSHTHDTRYYTETESDNRFLGLSATATDSELLGNNLPSYYLDATNINSGTISNDHLPSSITSDITGNSATTTKLETPFAITLTGDVSGVLSGDISGMNYIDGDEDVTLDITVADDSHTHDTRYYTETESDSRFLGINATSDNSDLLGNNLPSYYLNATNINSGTISDVYLPNTISSSITGNSATTTKLESPININLTGDVSGSVTSDISSSINIDGSENITFDVTVADDSHIHDTRYYTEIESDNKFLGINATADNSTLLDNNNSAYYLDWTNTTNKPDPTLTLDGDVTGSITMTNLTGGTYTITVNDDSHNHIISNVDGLQNALDSKLNSSVYTASDVLSKIKTVDGTGSGLDADYLDGNHASVFELNTNKNIANGYAGLDDSAKIPLSLIPDLGNPDTFVINSTDTRPTGSEGDKIYEKDTGDSYIHDGTSWVIQADADWANINIDWTNINNKPDPTITLGGDLSGSVTLTDLGNGTLTATVADDSHNHIIGNVDGLQTALDGKLDSNSNAVSASKLNTARTISLGGDLSGSISFDGSSNVTLSATVSDDSHNHTIGNIDNLQSSLDAKLNSSIYTASDVLNKLKSVDGIGSGVNADLLDGLHASNFIRTDTDIVTEQNVTVNGTMVANNGYNVGNYRMVDDSATDTLRFKYLG